MGAAVDATAEGARRHPYPAAPHTVGTTCYTGAGSFSSSVASWVPAVRASFDGHQLLSPTTVMIAGTSMLRTMNVSPSTATETTKPIMSSTSSGSIASTANVPARMRPALVITGPVTT